MLYKYKKILFRKTVGWLISSLFMMTIAYATPAMLQFQTMKQQLNLTRQSFKSVQLKACFQDSCIIQVTLTPKATNLMHKFAVANMNRKMNIVWQEHIISTPIIRTAINSKLEIIGFTKAQAKNFIKKMQRY